MTGLLFIGGEFPAAEYIISYLNNQKPDLIVAADSGALAALDCGMLPSLLVGDMDSISPDIYSLLKKQGVEMITFIKDKDFSDTQLALSLMRERGVSHLIMAGGGGGRLDHLTALLRGMEEPSSANIWITKSDVIVKIDREMQFSIQPDADISFFPVGHQSNKFESNGLTWELNGLSLNHLQFSLSNRCSSGEFSIKPPEEGVLLLITSLSSLLQIKGVNDST